MKRQRRLDLPATLLTIGLVTAGSTGAIAQSPRNGFDGRLIVAQAQPKQPDAAATAAEQEAAKRKAEKEKKDKQAAPPAAKPTPPVRKEAAPSRPEPPKRQAPASQDVPKRPITTTPQPGTTPAPVAPKVVNPQTIPEKPGVPSDRRDPRERRPVLAKPEPVSPIEKKAITPAPVPQAKTVIPPTDGPSILKQRRKEELKQAAPITPTVPTAPGAPIQRRQEELKQAAPTTPTVPTTPGAPLQRKQEELKQAAPIAPTVPTTTPGTPTRPGVVAPVAAGGAAGIAAQKLSDVQGNRKELVVGSGAARRTEIREPGNRTIIKQDNRVIIRHDETARFRGGASDVRTRRRPDGFNETVIVRPGGVTLVSVVDRDNRLVRRYRRDGGGREVNLIDNRRFYRNAALIGVGALAIGVALNLRPPVVRIPRERYIVDYERASDDDLYETLYAPPIERLDRAYSLDEVRQSYPLRQRMRRIDLDSITFEFGAWEVTPDQYGKLERVANAIKRVLAERPEEVFLIEGHTDAVGNDVDNLSLSDRRAESVADVLSRSFEVPPENLVTQGYGEQHLKVPTQEAERLNRRVAVVPVGGLMKQSANQ